MPYSGYMTVHTCMPHSFTEVNILCLTTFEVGLVFFVSIHPIDGAKGILFLGLYIRLHLCKCTRMCACTCICVCACLYLGIGILRLAVDF